jgi:hypothetical protein
MADRFQKKLDSDLSVGDVHIESPSVNHQPVYPNAAPLEQANPASILPEEEEDPDVHEWQEFEDYEIDVFWSQQNRDYDDILGINKILAYFERLLIKQKKDISQISDLKHIQIMQEHFRLFAAGMFTYEKEFENAQTIYAKLNKSITKFCHSFDTQMVQTKLIQLLFPLDLIDNYLSLVNRTYGQPVYDKTLRMQTSMMEIFLWHHVKSDTRFNLSMSTANLNLIDPFLRIKIRESNKNNEQLRQKYFNSKFDLKKFVYKILDLYFPNVTWRYIGGGQQMHRWSLQLVLVMFELGLWEYEELNDIVSVLFQKLENLLILEDRSYKDFDTSLKAYPEFSKKLKQYFYECKEMTTGICLHIILLINDHSFKQSHNMFNSKHKVDAVKAHKVWQSAYFNNSEISSILHRILTKYILRPSKDKGIQFSKKTIQYASDFLMLVTDPESDMFYVSSKTVNKSTLRFYLEPHKKDTLILAKTYREKMIRHLDVLATCIMHNSIKRAEAPLIQDLKEVLVAIANLNGEERKLFQYNLALNSFPNILLPIIGLLTHLKASRECKSTAVLAFVEATKGSVIGQVLFLDNPGVEHIKLLFEEEPLLAMLIIEEVFKEDFHIFYVHRTIYNNFIDYFHSNANNFMANIKDYDAEEKAEDGQRVYLEPKKWYEEFRNEVTGERSTQLEELLTYCLYVRWLISLFEEQDTDFEEKFEEFVLQRALQRPFFDFFFRILKDPDFLPKHPDGTYDFTPHLRNITPSGIDAMVTKKEEGSLSDTDLRGVVFEAAVLSLELINRCCDRFYTNCMFTTKVQPIIDSLLADTEYLVELEGGLEYRGLVLQLYSLMKIFPNNHLLSNRESICKGPKAKCEAWIPTNHLQGEIADNLVEQINFTSKISEKRHFQKDLQHQGKKYFFEGLFPMIMKYTKGMTFLYSNDPNLEGILTSFNKIDEALKHISGLLAADFNIQLSSHNPTQGQGQTPASIFGLGKLAEESHSLFSPQHNSKKSSDSSKPDNLNNASKRLPDNEEKYYPKLYDLRETMLSITARITKAYNDANDKIALEAQIQMDHTLVRANPLTTKDYFDHETEVLLNISSVYSSEVKEKSNQDLMSLLVSRTGLDNKHMLYFKELMWVYMKNKQQALSKDKESNIFIKFLESGAGSVENIVSFFVTLINDVYKNILTTNDDKKNSPKDAQDQPLVMFLETDLLFSFMSFLDRVSNECHKIKIALLDQIKNTEEGKNFLSLVYRITLDLGQICQYKTFMDYEWKLMMSRFKVMTSFLKNLCENNFTEFKKLLAEFVPSISQIPSFNSEKKDLFYHLYTWIEANAGQYKLTNTHHRLLMNDRAEVYPVLGNYFKIISECVAGPYKPNQDRIYTFRTDFWMSVVNRIVDNMTSNCYEMKDTMLDYIIAITEENSDTTNHMANNTTFMKLFDLIYLLLKRLYIVTTVLNKKKKHKALVELADKTYKQKIEKRKDDMNKYETYLNSQFGFYSQKAATKDFSDMAQNLHLGEMIGGQGEEDEDVAYFEPNNSNFVNTEMQDCVKVTDYKTIKETYLRNEKFSSSKLLSLVIKLNDLLLKFAKQQASYSINLDNIYTGLIDRYGEDVPLHIRKNFLYYERNPNFEFNEKMVFYMFLMKITAEIQIKSDENDIRLLYPLMPCTFFMTDQTKSEFMMSVDHSMIITCLVDKFDVFQVEMNENLAFYRRWPRFYWLSSDDSFSKIKAIIWFLGFILNVLLIIFYRRDEESSTIDPEGFKAIIALGVLIGCLSFTFLLIWMMSRYSQKVKNAKIANELPKDVHSRGYAMFIYRLKIFLYYGILKESYPVFFSFHLLSCILGLTVNPFFLTLQLLTIVFISETTLYVVQAITTHFDQLILTFILSVFVMYCYAVLTSEAFFGTLSSNADGLRDCTYLWDCFLYHVNFGIRQGGGIADVTTTVSPTQRPGYYVAKFFFDLMFFILINIISLNIIFGIIIDTFADMRDENSARSKLYSSRKSFGFPMSTLFRK